MGTVERKKNLQIREKPKSAFSFLKSIDSASSNQKFLEKFGLKRDSYYLGTKEPLFLKLEAKESEPTK